MEGKRQAASCRYGIDKSAHARCIAPMKPQDSDRRIKVMGEGKFTASQALRVRDTSSQASRVSPHSLANGSAASVPMGVRGVRDAIRTAGRRKPSHAPGWWFPSHHGVVSPSVIAGIVKRNLDRRGGYEIPRDGVGTHREQSRRLPWSGGLCARGHVSS